MLTEVSTDYYIRLEQGREQNPSDRVLDALARVFQLDPEAVKHLYQLAHPRPHRRRSTGRTTPVSPNVLRFMESCDHAPAFVTGRWMDLLARNSMGAALHSGLDHVDNILWMTFLDPAAREFFVDWEEEALSLVAHLRAAAGADLDDPHLTELVDDLSFESEEFRRMWARHDVRTKADGPRRLHHPDVGDLTLWPETFHIAGTPGQQLIVAQAEPGSPSEHALTRLRTLAAS